MTAAQTLGALVLAALALALEPHTALGRAPELLLPLAAAACWQARGGLGVAALLGALRDACDGGPRGLHAALFVVAVVALRPRGLASAAALPLAARVAVAAAGLLALTEPAALLAPARLAAPLALAAALAPCFATALAAFGPPRAVPR